MIPLLAAVCHAAPPPPLPVVTPAPADPAVEVRAALAAFDSEPSVREVQRWAAAHAQASPAQTRRWLRQSSRFAWLPRTTVEWRFSDGDDQRFDYVDPSGDPLLPGAEPAPVIDQATSDRDAAWRVRLDWDLADLVMSSERIRVIDEVQDLVELRDAVVTEVTQLYFERRRLQVERHLRPPLDAAREVRDELRLQELTARIDASTGGAFSAALARTRSAGAR